MHIIDNDDDIGQAPVPTCRHTGHVYAITGLRFMNMRVRANGALDQPGEGHLRMIGEPLLDACNNGCVDAHRAHLGAFARSRLTCVNAAACHLDDQTRRLFQQMTACTSKNLADPSTSILVHHRPQRTNGRPGQAQRPSHGLSGHAPTILDEVDMSTHPAPSGQGLTEATSHTTWSLRGLTIPSKWSIWTLKRASPPSAPWLDAHIPSKYPSYIVKRCP